VAGLRIRHTVIMAAGRGLRMGPLTDVIPKPMAPYLNSTLIGVGIEKMRPSAERIHVTVGYKGAMLAQHLIERGVDSVFNTEGHGNAWWIYHTLLAALDEPVFVLTCDNVTDIDFASLEAEYFAADAPPCLIVPVRPVEGVEGDFITHDEQVVTGLGRERATDLYASGIQIVNPARINALCPGGDSFYDVWRPLIERRLLRVSKVQPRAWFSVDTIADLQKLR
jgi:NDP-sugar pyrophosphorylase family protein